MGIRGMQSSKEEDACLRERGSAEQAAQAGMFALVLPQCVLKSNSIRGDR